MIPYYHDEVVTIYHGDMRQILPGLNPCDHVLTDPPYDRQTHKGARSMRFGPDIEIEMGFDPVVVEAVVPLLLRASLGWTIVFSPLELLGEYRRIAGELYIRGGFWHRPNGTPQLSGDRPAQPGEGLAILNRRDGRMTWNRGGHQAFYACGVEHRDRQHPAQKPGPLMAQLIADFTQPGEVICDPFAGYGTTLVEAKRLGRQAVGIELDERWCEKMAKRLTQGVLPFTY